MPKIIGYAFLLSIASGVLYVLLNIYNNLENDEFFEYLPQIIDGLIVTFILAGVSYGVGMIVSFILVFWSNENKVVAKMMILFQKIIRYIPVLAMLYLVYYGSGEFSFYLEQINLWWFFREPLLCALLVFTITSCAYQSYILVGCLQSVDVGQKEAAESLGFTPRRLLFRIIFPQAIRFAIRPLGQELISLTKISCLANVITVFDLLGVLKTAYSETFNATYFLLAAIIYVLVVWIIGFAVESFAKFFEIPEKELAFKLK
jgi:polar amino acid transport system permease protein